MSHIEVLKQALEALELMYACYAHPEWISHKQQEEKILAQCVATTMTLRQAVAETEKTTLDISGATGPSIEPLNWHAEANKQEPVGFITNRRQRMNVEIKPSAFVWQSTVQDWEIPLYTHPAQPKAEQKRPQNCGTNFCSCIECIIEPEPVAWLVEFENGDQELHFDEQSAGETHVPLYTHPAQPKAEQEPVAFDLLKSDSADCCPYCEALIKQKKTPLTFEQIRDLWLENYNKGGATDAFARSIELAHGIK